MEAMKFNKRAGKYTPVCRPVTTFRGWEFILMIDSKDLRIGGTGELLVRYPIVLNCDLRPTFFAVKDVSYKALRDWLIKKAES